MELKMQNPFISSGGFIKERDPIVSSGAHEKKLVNNFYFI